jgi:hypothetical protein
MEDFLPHAHNFYIPPTSQLYVRYFVASLILLYFLHFCDNLLHKNVSLVVGGLLEDGFCRSKHVREIKGYKY